MKKEIIAALLCMSLALCGCTKNEKKPSQSQDDNIIIPSDTGPQSYGDDLINKNSRSDSSAPDGSISFEDACKKLDECPMSAFYLPQSMKDYKKYLFNIVNRSGEEYYSVYPYIEVSGKKIYVGTNALVNCKTGKVLTKNWMGGYEPVDTAAEPDTDYTVRYPDAKISPNQALTLLAENKKRLDLEKDISEYVFEIDESIAEPNGTPCYKISPKLEYTDHIDILGSYYVSVEGKNNILVGKKGDQEEYDILL